MDSEKTFLEGEENLMNTSRTSDTSVDKEVSLVPKQTMKLATLVKRAEPWAILRLIDKVCVDIEDEIAKAEPDEMEAVCEAMRGFQLVYIDSLMKDA